MPAELSTENALSFPLEQRIITVGRDPSCDIRLKGFGVSSFHARLFLDEERVIIEDMENSSGILIDGRLVHREELASGSILAIGVNKLSITIASASLVIRRMNEPENSTGPG